MLDAVKESLGESILDEIAKYGGDVVLQGAPAPTPDKARFSFEPVPVEALQSATAFKLSLERLRAQFDPAWEFKTRKGRLNPLRYSQGADIDELFDKFEQGREDAVDIEAVILLDTSGSMAGDQIRRASDSMWGIKRALDAVNASCTVVGFSFGASLLYSADEQALALQKRNVQAGGGTNPLEALQYANHVLATSERKVKLLFVITDGDWGTDANEERQRSERIIKNLRDGGVLTSLAYVGWVADAESLEANRHNCEVLSQVTNSSDLLHVGKAVVDLAIARNLVNA